MKAILVIEFEETVKELVSILIQNGYKVTVAKTGYYWEYKYQVEVSKDESNLEKALEKSQKGENSNERL